MSRLAFVLLIVFTSCASYKKNVMFRVTDTQSIKQEAEQTQRNYTIQKNDLIKLSVFTKNGERIIDPDMEFLKSGQDQNPNFKPDPSYLVDIQGVVKFPMVGQLQVEGLTLRQAEEILQKEYTRFYSDTFVKLEYVNKRVVVLGAPGGQVIPLMNENIRLTEALALAKGIDNFSNAQNIRVLRGDQVYVADFSTINGYLKNNLVLQPGDIIYVEPVRRPIVEGLRDYAPVISIISTLTALIVVIFTVK
ncbi:MAG: polysaccharide biosynthesis/export family protein [Flammeovirgaceae bacterium]|nr:polysaccharide biosynthesis/export family protein [Flammeovirgaceae bacterium]